MQQGAPGSDGMTVEALGGHLKDHRPVIRFRVLAGTCVPQPGRRVAIPKTSGGARPLGVTTVLDRFIQQAVMEVLRHDWDESFSDASYGIRHGRYSTAPVRPASASTVDVPVETDGSAGCLALTRLHAANAAIDTPDTALARTLVG